MSLLLRVGNFKPLNRYNMYPETPAIIFSGTASQYLASEICDEYGCQLGKSTKGIFSDGEFETYFEETVRGKFVFIIQSTFPPTENLFELLLMVDAAKRASAYKIIAVIPYFGFARQDRKDKPRVSIGAKLVADLLTTAGIDRLITMELHADQIQGFFNVPVDHLYSSTVFYEYLTDLKLPNLIIASPDTGGTKRAKIYSKLLGVDLVICHKTRSKANHVEKVTVIGDVAGKDVVLIDDIVDTGGSITEAARVIMSEGASSVRAIVTHPVLSGPAIERIENSVLEEMVVTNSIPLKKTCSKIKVLSIAKLFSEVITKVHTYQSISTTYISS